ncbi:MAG: FAD-dependent oxidoreductase [Deltaproteobacteria bacterium]
MLTHLFEPLRIGTMEVPNRIAMAPMGVEIIDDDGHLREATLRYYEERARGGAGLIISEVSACAYPLGANARRQIASSSDEYLPGLRELARRMHAHGAKVALQLVHHGKASRLDMKEGREVLMPSKPQWHGSMSMGNDLSHEEIMLMIEATGGGRPKIKEATREDLVWVVEQFANAAERCQRAGIDAVEIHGAHGYLLAEFLSPCWNHREDEYGGPLENRARLLCEVIRATKAKAGSDFPVIVRLDAKEFRTPDGITFEDAKKTAQLAVQAGADAIHITAYADATSAPGFTDGPLPHTPSAYIDFAAGVKKVVDVPVIAVGRIEPDIANRIIGEGKADMVSMARKLLADPHLPRKLREDRAAEIRPCIYCYVCVAQAFFDRAVRCAVNPVTAHEAELADAEGAPAAQEKHVLIVGGGPAGMEAARVAAGRGHRVTLCEKGGQLGGALRFGAVVYEPNERLLRWYEGQMARLGIDLRLDTEVTAEFVRQLAPDALFVANGSAKARPKVPGVDRNHVMDGDDLRALLTGQNAEVAARKLSFTGRLAVRAGRAIGLTSDPARIREASKAYMPVGKRVVVIGGGLVGCEIGEFLAERGRDVTILEAGPTPALEMAHPRRFRVLHEMAELGVKVVRQAQVKEITDTSVIFAVAQPEGGTATAETAADSVIIATGLTANPALGEALAGLAGTVEVLGDATGVEYLEGAIRDGFAAAMRL